MAVALCCAPRLGAAPLTTIGFAKSRRKWTLARDSCFFLPGSQPLSGASSKRFQNSRSTCSLRNSRFTEKSFDSCISARRLFKSPQNPYIPRRELKVDCKSITDDAGDSLARNLELEPSTRGRGTQPANQFNGIFLLLILNIGIYVADHLLRLPVARRLYLNHVQPEWWQFVTSTFCHFNWNHLSSNLFFLYIFGKLVEEEEGSFGVCASYLVTGLGANVVSYFLLPHSSGGAAVASCGASGAVFGLFAISVLVKLSWNWRKILEVLILGQFVVEKVIAEAAMSARGTKGLLSGGINHIAHLAGALVGVALIYLITRIPEVAAGGKDRDLLK